MERSEYKEQIERSTGKLRRFLAADELKRLKLPANAKPQTTEREHNLALAAQEHHYIQPETGGDIRVVVAYPNRYWIAMSNLGFQAVYKLFVQQPRMQVERAFIPEKSDEYRTFESHAQLRTAEILAVSVSFETDYLQVLDLLEAAGLRLNECVTNGDERKECYRPLIIGGGAALTLNPEPLANYFDAIVLGEAEEIVAEISQAYIHARDNAFSFEQLLISLSKIEGVYVPSLYTVHYKSDDTIREVTKFGDAPAPIPRRYVKDISKFKTTTVIQTPQTEFRDMYMTETGRGCEVGCKFCVSGYMYRPTRKRSADTIAETIQIGIENSESVGFVGAAVSSHPKIAELASSVARAGKRAALSSIMSQKVTPELAASLSESEYKTVALAPEAGSEQLRFRVGKRVCNDQIVKAVATLAESGIRNFKLYCMVGLPSETLEEVAEIPKLVSKVQKAALAAARLQSDFSVAPTILLSVNPFIPKAWTPFQRHGFMPFNEVKLRLEIVRQGIRHIPNVEMKAESPRESYFQALVSRGDRRVGDLLLEMKRLGEDWRWLVRNGNERILPHVPPADFYVHRLIGETEQLPWEIVDMHIKRSLLEREYARTFDEDVAPLIERRKKELEMEGVELPGCQ